MGTVRCISTVKGRGSIHKVSWQIVGIQLMTHVFIILGEKGEPVIDYIASLNWEQCPSRDGPESPFQLEQ